jgi:kynurenine formamidase
MIKQLIAGFVLAAIAHPLNALDLGEIQLVDLSHSYSEETLYWPTSPSKFEMEELAFGPSEGGWFYSSYSVCTPEHGGTHLDAPIHFAEGGLTTDEIPLNKLVAPAVVIDVSAMASADRNFRLRSSDVLAFEARHGRIAPGTIVLLRTGWSEHWPDAMSYLGDDTPGDAGHLQFPGYGADAGRLLVEDRKIAILGIDTASIDYGKSKDFIVHQIAAAQGIVNLENLTGLEQLPASGFYVAALPMKIAGGSGGPVRVVAMIPEKVQDTHK